MSPKRRVGGGHSACIVFAVTFTAASAVVCVGAVWAKRSIVDPAGLERTILEVAEEPVVRREFSDALTANVVSQNGARVLTDAPALYAAADATVTSPGFAEAVLLEVQDAPRSLSASNRTRRIDRTANLFAARLRSVRPDLARRLPAVGSAVLDTEAQGLIHRGLVDAHRLASLRLISAFGVLAGCVAFVRLSRPRVQGFVLLGVTLLAAGAGVMATRAVTISVVGRSLPSGPDRALVLAVLRSASEPIGSAWIAVVWGIVLVVTCRTSRERTSTRHIGVPRRPAASALLGRRSTVRRLAIRYGLLLMLPVTLGVLRHQTKPGRALTCLGFAELCDRPIDRITLAATHNSMSARADEFVFPEQELGVQGQLDSGIRGFLIDTHYGKASRQGRIWTDLIGIDRATLVHDYGEDAVKAGEQARAALVEPNAPRGVYLCHDFCELGATRMRDMLRVVGSFLDTHPTEIVVLFVQDQTSPSDTVREFDAAELSEQAYTPTSSGTWPTVRQLISQHTRLIVLTEHQRGAARWYQRGFDRLVADTSYAARTVGDLAGCAPNRGPRTATLLLMNHWIQRFPARPEDAIETNARARIEGRAKTCLVERGRFPNLIAVNWAQTGDVISAVKELNHLRR